ncbi:hypothetical protein VOI54_03920 [Tamlana sp. 2201CG12-4]|uniref:hypothetical protein n=1 Tax=Tamlana sp. 2201CG12-4 TaxID=3112582 RepID=UPI002DBF5537|nr:hypothetical protein [Tamlana sp. 2201CG12-4]MEC3906151.1 hypothetical protein [Tamlana sp. 2201CG12-4]
MTLSTGADGGHKYLSTEIEYKGIKRKMTVLFKNKPNERKLEEKSKLTVNGTLMDEGPEQSLMLLDSEIIE